MNYKHFHCPNGVVASRSDRVSPVQVIQKRDKGCKNKFKGDQQAIAIGGDGIGNIAIAVNLVLQSNICNNETEVEFEGGPLQAAGAQGGMVGGGGKCGHGCDCSNKAKSDQETVAIAGDGIGNLAISANVILQSNICGNETEIELGALPPFCLTFDGVPTLSSPVQGAAPENVSVTVNGKVVSSDQMQVDTQTQPGKITMYFTPKPQ